MLVRIALAAALLGASPALAATPSDRTGAPVRCVVAHQTAPHGKGILTPIVKCDAKATELARDATVDNGPAAPRRAGS
jgi:hypothetical protein